MQTTSTILAIDPGYDRVGWAVGRAEAGSVVPLDFGCIVTDRSQTLPERYRQIDTELTRVFAKYQPQEAAVETIFFSKNQATAMRVSEARGVIISCVLRHQAVFYEYDPVTIKQAVTGFGKADKQAVEKMVRMQLGKEMDAIAQHKDEVPHAKLLDDTLDALAILITHAASVAFTKRV